MTFFNNLKQDFFFIIGTNVIESPEHTINLAIKIKNICDDLKINFIFKVSFDKANRTSIESYRGIDIYDAIKIFKKLKELNIKILTDIHEPFQAEIIKNYVDIIQIPAFLCRQTDLLIAAAKTDKIIQIKKGQFTTSESLHKSAEKIRLNGNNKIILCERGTMFGYNDLIVDSRNLIKLRGDNLVSMDITHCLQQPSKIEDDGIIKSGGLREFIPEMAKLAITFNCNGIFMEVHEEPDKALCDGPTQLPLDNLQSLLFYLKKFHLKINSLQYKKFNKKICFIPARYKSSRLPGKPLLKINGKTMINRVYNNVKKCKLIDEVIVLTDDERIREEVVKINGKCEIITDNCLNGTERIVKFIEKNKYDCDLIINVQGDEPYINPNDIDMCIENFINNDDEKMKCSTLHFNINKNIDSRNTGKIVLDKYNNILYCSRNIIPGTKNNKINSDNQYYGHKGIFVFDKKYLLNEYLNGNSPYQISEDIEWLKILEDGYRINSCLIKEPEISVDTKQDFDFLVDKYEK